MKRAIIILLLIQASVFTAKAQIGYNYAQWGLGTGVSYLTGNTGVLHQSGHPSVNFNLNYNASPYIGVSLDFQFGTLSGGFNEYYPGAVAALDIKSAKYDSLLTDIVTQYKKQDYYLRNYTNNYQMLTLNVNVQMGEFMDYAPDNFLYRNLKNVYVGTGLGLVFNNISDNNSRLSPDSTYYIGGQDVSQNVVIPLRVGYQFKVFNSYDMPNILVEFSYQHNWVLGYGLDGYADPVVVTKRFEQFSGFHAGIKFNFGSITSYRRPIH